jgi:(2Fe-2S) ferredoxin
MPNQPYASAFHSVNQNWLVPASLLTAGRCCLYNQARCQKVIVVELYKKHVFVCTSGKTCPQEGGEQVCKALRHEIAERSLKKQIRINKSGCLDQCGNGPMVVVYPEQVWYAHVAVEDAAEIVESHLLGGEPVQRLLYDGRGKIV